MRGSGSAPKFHGSAALVYFSLVDKYPEHFCPGRIRLLASYSRNKFLQFVLANTLRSCQNLSLIIRPSLEIFKPGSIPNVYKCFLVMFSWRNSVTRSGMKGKVL